MTKTKTTWLTRREFAKAYAHKWKLLSPPGHDTCARWARLWKKKGLARAVENPAVGSGKYWLFSSRTLEIPPMVRGPKQKRKKKV